MSNASPTPSGLPTVSVGGRRYDRARLLASVEAKLFGRADATVNVGRYVLGERIGKGGFGVVYRGEDPVLRRTVAIKLLRSRRSDGNLGGPEGLIREARMAAQIDHPHVVRVFDVGRVETERLGDDVFVVMELLDGHQFNRWSKAKQPPLRRIVGLMVEVAEGIAAAHAQEVVHCDVKPANVFVTSQGHAKVLDFGLALHSSQRMSDLTADGSNDEEAGAFVAGTPPYMAPEAHGGSPLRPSSDQYSYGVMLAEAIAGVYPFPRGSIETIYRAKRNGLDPAWVRQHVPRGLQTVVRRTTHPDPGQRYASMREVADVLRDWLRPAAVGPWMIGALVLTVGAGVGWAAVPRSPHCTLHADAAQQVWADAEPAPRPAGGGWKETSRARFDEAAEDFADAWATATQTACDAGAQPQAMACLRGQLSQFGAVVEQVASDDVVALQHADELASSLGEPGVCAKASADLMPMPHSPAQWPEVDRVRDAIATARATSLAAEFGEGVALAKRAHADAVALGFAPVEAEALLQLGVAMARSTQYAGAVEHLEQAYFAAEGLRLEDVAARAAVQLVALYGNRLRDEPAAQSWVRRAETGLDRLPSPAGLRADLAFSVGKIEQRARRVETARAAFEDAKQRYVALERVQDQSRTEIALGELELAAGESARANALFRAVYEERAQRLGAEHPYTAFARGFLGLGLLSNGDLQGARAHYLGAIEVLESTVGPMHNSVGSMLGNVGAIESRLGYFEDALEHTQRALDRLRTRLPEGHIAFAIGFDNLAAIHLELGNHAEAHRLDTLALDIRKQRLPPDHPHVARSHAKIAHSLAELGRGEEATLALAQAEQASAQQPDPDLGVRLMLARARVAMGERPVAALSELSERLPKDDVGRFVALFELAKLRASDDPARAVQHARDAVAGFEALDAEPRAAVVRQWLRAAG